MFLCSRVVNNCSDECDWQVLRDALEKLRNTAPRKLKDVQLLQAHIYVPAVIHACVYGMECRSCGMLLTPI